MRVLVLLVTMLTSSSCVVFGLGAVLGATGARKHYREGAAQEARVRAQHAREAAVARQQHRELERRFTSTAASDLPRARSEPTPPPLVGAEPSRTPLRPR